MTRFLQPLLATLLAANLLCASTLVTTSAGAQDARDKALAEELFQQGRTLMDEGKTEAACARFEQSQKLEEKLGTLLNMAACHEKLGRSASAWAEFTEAATIADKRGETDRASYAREHADALESKLSKVVIKNTNPPAGLVVTLDGKPLLVGVLGAPLPLDPGAHTLAVNAPGKQGREIPFNVPAGPTVFDVMIPLLQDAPEPLPGPTPTPPPGPTPTPGPVPGGSAGSSTPVLAIVGFSVGGAGLLLGAITGGVSLSMASSLSNSCSGGICVGSDASDLSTATALANVSNVSFGVGIVGAVVGVVGLFVDTGDSGSGDASAARVRIVPVGDAGAGVRLQF